MTETKTSKGRWRGVMLLVVALAMGCGGDETSTPTADSKTEPDADSAAFDAAQPDETWASADSSATDTAQPSDVSTSSDGVARPGDAGETSSFDYEGESNVGSCTPNDADAARYAIVGF